jgi:hypothetical protein
VRGAATSCEARRVADGRLELGRELLRLRAPGRVLALGAVRGLAEVVRAFMAPLFGLAVVRLRAVLDLAVVLALAAPDFGLAAVRDRLVLALAVLALAGRRADVVDRLAVPGRLAVLDRFVVLDRLAAGRAGVAGLADDIALAAVVRALAAVVMALVAVFIDCIAVDIVLADELARVAAWVILDAAELTLVAAEETVRAAVAGVAWELRAVLRRAAELRTDDRAAVVRVLRRGVLRELRVLVLRAGFAVRLAVALVPLVRVDFAAVVRAADRVLDLVLGRPAELLALVLIDRVLREAAGLRRAVARDVVCTGTAFPPSCQLRGCYSTGNRVLHTS